MKDKESSELVFRGFSGGREMSEEKYKCGDGLEFPKGGWNFNSDVSRVFQSHVSKSVPGYNNVHKMVADICMMVDNRDRTLEVLDIGCSLGQLEKVILDEWDSSPIHITAVDPSSDMIDRAHKEDRITYKVCDGITALDTQDKYDVIVSLYTCQFMNDIEREAFPYKVVEALKDGGTFILADKFESDDNDIDLINEKGLFSFKMDKGFTVEEIVGKKKALSGVQNRLKDSYVDEKLSKVFSSVKVLDVSLNFKCYVFVK